jgi:hypothetical protein
MLSITPIGMTQTKDPAEKLTRFCSNVNIILHIALSPISLHRAGRADS